MYYVQLTYIFFNFTVVHGKLKVSNNYNYTF